MDTGDWLIIFFLLDSSGVYDVPGWLWTVMIVFFVLQVINVLAD